ncbi:ABC transporter permease [Brevibacterium senegalense]|uniref:ABC transporter permease n=1 Tax=Brevibacterium senegalense TaxID=1033736 RepID=UPI0002E80BDC|nr:ABC transporter permease [Brevibacterium senegalense]
MNARAIMNEFAKMRHLRVGLFVALLAISVALMSMYNAFGSGAFERLDDPNDYAWKTLFGGLGMGAALIAPILVAVIASRQVEIEHTGNGWLSSATSGLTPGQMCRAKFVSLGVLVAAATAVWGVVIVGFGTLIGISTPAPLGRWAAYIGALIIINLAVLAFHILLSAKVENQLVCIGVGLVGMFLAIFGELFPAWLAHLVPWGYYPLTVQSDYVGEVPVYFDLPYLSVIGLAVVGGALFLFVTGRFDRQEA